MLSRVTKEGGNANGGDADVKKGKTNLSAFCVGESWAVHFAIRGTRTGQQHCTVPL
jgi:hypothetical protein